MKKLLSIVLGMTIIMSIIPGAYAKEIFDSEDNKAVVSPNQYQPIKNSTSSVLISHDFLMESEIEQLSEGIVLSRDTLLSKQAGTESYVKELVCIYPGEGVSIRELETKINEVIVSQRSSGSKYESLPDDSYSLTAYTTIYYDRKTDDKGELIKLTSVSGGYTISDRQVKVISQSLEYGCTGFIEGGGTYMTQNADYGPSSSAWSINTPSSWKYVYTSSPIVGAYYWLKLQRIGNAYTWDLAITNNVYDYS